MFHTCNLRRGLTMAQYLSADRAVSVKTDTPMLMSLADSETLHTTTPHGHDSTVYRIEVKGMTVMMTSRSAKASEKMYLKKK